tara:strand:- start:952 stop:1362 length:411 start_codon:yes stop_codon:yes gene_type:complete
VKTRQEQGDGSGGKGWTLESYLCTVRGQCGATEESDNTVGRLEPIAADYGAVVRRIDDNLKPTVGANRQGPNDGGDGLSRGVRIDGGVPLVVGQVVGKGCIMLVKIYGHWFSPDVRARRECLACLVYGDEKLGYKP